MIAHPEPINEAEEHCDQVNVVAVKLPDAKKELIQNDNAKETEPRQQPTPC